MAPRLPFCWCGRKRGQRDPQQPDRSQKQYRDIVESACHHDAVHMIVIPCPLCQATVEVHPSEINRTRLNMSVTYDSQLMAVASVDGLKVAGLGGYMIRPTSLQVLAQEK